MPADPTSRLAIDLIAPTHDDLLLAERLVATEWLALERSMITDCRDGTGRGRRDAVRYLGDAMDVQIHISRRLSGARSCESDCWVCKRAAHQAAEAIDAR